MEDESERIIKIYTEEQIKEMWDAVLPKIKNSFNVKFKTFITATGEYGLIEYNERGTYTLSTSTTPQLFGIQTTLVDLFSYWGEYIDNEDKKFISQNWKLVECEITLK